jgi:SAM-dependent methyltransferase
MKKKSTFPPAENLANYNKIIEIISRAIIEKARVNGTLNILEAGCGRKWFIDLRGVNYKLTGVDIDKNALDIRKNKLKDLDIAINADLQSVLLEKNSFDIIYNENVLEHVNGADVVLSNFVNWLKPKGIMILLFPNRDSAYAFLVRITPHWVHVFFKKYIERNKNKNAGKPGYDPYPVYFNKVVSRQGIYEFCERNGLNIKAEYRWDNRPVENLVVWIFTQIMIWCLHLFSFTRLSVNYRNLLYIIMK